MPIRISKFICSLGLLVFLVSLSSAQTFTTFNAPGSSTTPTNINSGGVITGWYNDTTGTHGFLRDATGTITTFDVPGAIGTTPTSISSTGLITGRYADANSVLHGFLRDAAGNITTFDVPNSLTTAAFSINADGETTGFFLDRFRTVHGFLRNA